jgi:hypothetical protein
MKHNPPSSPVVGRRDENKSSMRTSITIFSLFSLGFVCVFCMSCSTSHTEVRTKTQSSVPDASRFVALPQLQVPLIEYVWTGPGWVSVDLNDGVQRNEAAAIAQAYADRFVSNCGMASDPVDYGGFWQVYFGIGQWDVNHVYFRIWKDGRAFIGPSEKGFPKNTKLLLERLPQLHLQ